MTKSATPTRTSAQQADFYGQWTAVAATIVGLVLAVVR